MSITWAEELRRRRGHLANVRRWNGRASAVAKEWEEFVKAAEREAEKEQKRDG